MSVQRLEAPEELNEHTGQSLMQSLERGVRKGESIVVDVSRTQRMDARGGAWLVRLSDLARIRDGEFHIEGAQGQVKEFIELLGPALTAEGHVKPRPMGILEETGDATLSAIGEFRQFFDLLIDGVYWTLIAPLLGRGVGAICSTRCTRWACGPSRSYSS